jgi:glucose/arabinose dehydrogenase
VSARHRQPSSAPQVRLRSLIIALIAIFLVAFFFLRGSGGGGNTGGTTVPVAAGSTTTLAGSSSTTVPGASGSTSLGSTSSTSDLGPLQAVRLETISQDFQQPTVITAPAGDDRLFVAQRIGVIRILDADHQLLSPAFLDLSDRVVANGIEQGLLGLTFHPDYANNGRFFVYYTDDGGRRQLSEFQVSVSDPNIATPDSEKVLLELEQPENSVDIRHYAGQLAFGPDGYLWLSMGDGADSRAQAQNPNTFFGKVVRLDVDSGTEPYGIPPDNPFVSGGGLPEVWAYGLRNPWRFSIDPVDGLIYIGDVGHADLEEVDVLSIEEGGYNLGWSDMEGTRCFHKQDCDAADYTSPAITYSHSEGCSITGGYVYRGNEIPELNGTYFYSDWCNQWIRSFKYVDGQVTEETDWTEDLGTIGQINSFGLDGNGEMYAVTYEGAVARFVADR